MDALKERCTVLKDCTCVTNDNEDKIWRIRSWQRGILWRCLFIKDVFSFNLLRLKKIPPFQKLNSWVKNELLRLLFLNLRKTVNHLMGQSTFRQLCFELQTTKRDVSSWEVNMKGGGVRGPFPLVNNYWTGHLETGNQGGYF